MVRKEPKWRRHCMHIRLPSFTLDSTDNISTRLLQVVVSPIFHLHKLEPAKNSLICVCPLGDHTMLPLVQLVFTLAYYKHTFVRLSLGNVLLYHYRGTPKLFISIS